MGTTALPGQSQWRGPNLVPGQPESEVGPSDAATPSWQQPWRGTRAAPGQWRTATSVPNIPQPVAPGTVGDPFTTGPLTPDMLRMAEQQAMSGQNMWSNIPQFHTSQQTPIPTTSQTQPSVPSHLTSSMLQAHHGLPVEVMRNQSPGPGRPHNFQRFVDEPSAAASTEAPIREDVAPMFTRFTGQESPLSSQARGRQMSGNPFPVGGMMLQSPSPDLGMHVGPPGSSGQANPSANPPQPPDQYNPWNGVNPPTFNPGNLQGPIGPRGSSGGGPGGPGGPGGGPGGPQGPIGPGGGPPNGPHGQDAGGLPYAGVQEDGTQGRRWLAPPPWTPGGPVKLRQYLWLLEGWTHLTSMPKKQQGLAVALSMGGLALQLMMTIPPWVLLQENGLATVVFVLEQEWGSEDQDLQRQSLDKWDGYHRAKGEDMVSFMTNFDILLAEAQFYGLRMGDVALSRELLKKC